MKKRLDVFLVENDYYSTRNKAKAAIENGDISVDGDIIHKSSFMVDENNNINILKNSIPYVSRGGLKLEKALQSFCVDVKDKICLDIGASTGGFSDCLLQNGAKKIFCVDVGTNQLDDSLKRNNKIINMENTNFRDIDLVEFKNYNIEIIVADVSFISITYLFDNIAKITDNDMTFIGLIKPQFETIHRQHNKNGVVNDKKIHLKVIENVMQEANKYGLFLNQLDYSPIRGEKSGNIEYLGKFSFNKKNITLTNIHDIIDLSFKELR